MTNIEKEIRGEILFTATIKTELKYQGINLTKEMKDLDNGNFKPLKD